MSRRSTNLAIVSSLLVLAGCGGGNSAPTQSATHLSTNLRTLPSGLLEGTGAAQAAVIHPLAVKQAGDVSVSEVTTAPLPTTQAVAATKVVVNRTEKVLLRPLLVLRGQSFQRGNQMTVIGGGLGDSAREALLVLQGPGYRAERLVGVARGLAIATVTLPSQMTSGRWMLGYEELNGLHPMRNQKLGGTVKLDLAIYTLR
jgi:hypothetical protein